jgi:hypothetical protein
VSRTRLVPLALAVTLLVAVVAIAARGRPLGSHGGSGGLPLSFWDYAYTTIVILVVPLMLAGLLAASFIRRRRSEPRGYWESMLRTLVFFALLAGIEWLVIRHLHLRHLLQRRGTGRIQGDLLQQGKHRGGRHGSAATRGPRFRWEELVVILGLLGVACAAVLIGGKRSRRPRRRLESAPETLAAALDESLDDLRADPDLRRAIVAAYARMEAALAAAGVPRHPAEAPVEYLERTLLTLDASAESVRRLTDLFEWARFSHHEPEPSMRDDAVDALVAVRDELRASELVPA